MGSETLNRNPEAGRTNAESLKKSVNEGLDRLAKHPDEGIAKAAAEISASLESHPEALQSASEQLAALEWRLQRVEGEKNLAMARTVVGDFDRKNA